MPDFKIQQHAIGTYRVTPANSNALCDERILDQLLQTFLLLLTSVFVPSFEGLQLLLQQV